MILKNKYAKYGSFIIDINHGGYSDISSIAISIALDMETVDLNEINVVDTVTICPRIISTREDMIVTPTTFLELYEAITNISNYKEFTSLSTPSTYSNINRVIVNAQYIMKMIAENNEAYMRLLGIRDIDIKNIDTSEIRAISKLPTIL